MNQKKIYGTETYLNNSGFVHELVDALVAVDIAALQDLRPVAQQRTGNSLGPIAGKSLTSLNKANGKRN